MSGLVSTMTSESATSPMSVGDRTVVSFHYELKDQSGSAIETSRDHDPVAFLVGADNVLPGLERAMQGKGVGEQFSVTLAPEVAYGLRDEAKTDRVSAKYLKHEGKLKPGKVVRIDTNQGVKTATVLKVGKFSVDLDLNHPLAGQTITFDVEIVDIRAAEAEEIAHGHAHGKGGHHHD